MKRNANYLPLEVEVETVEAVVAAEDGTVVEGVAEAKEAEVVATWEANPAEKVSKETSLLDPMDQKTGRP